MMSTNDQTCGQELASSSSIVEQFARLFAHVAVNLRSHADWVRSMGAEESQTSARSGI